MMMLFALTGTGFLMVDLYPDTQKPGNGYFFSISDVISYTNVPCRVIAILYLVIGFIFFSGSFIQEPAF
jgi:hypothetical protein